MRRTSQVCVRGGGEACSVRGSSDGARSAEAAERYRRQAAQFGAVAV